MNTISDRILQMTPSATVVLAGKVSDPVSYTHLSEASQGCIRFPRAQCCSTASICAA